MRLVTGTETLLRADHFHQRHDPKVVHVLAELNHWLDAYMPCSGEELRASTIWGSPSALISRAAGLDKRLHRNDQPIFQLWKGAGLGFRPWKDTTIKEGRVGSASQDC